MFKNTTIALVLLICTFPLAAETESQIKHSTANDGQLVMQDVPEIPSSIAAALNRYQNVRSAPFLDWTKDGKSIYISTRFSDVNQIHRVDRPGGARHQLTFFNEPIGSVDRHDSSQQISFTMDQGGSEFDQIFIFDPATGETRMVSDGQSRNNAIVWDDNSNRIAYQSTRRNGKSNDIWMMSVDNPETAEPIMEAPDGSWWAPVAFSEAGGKLLVQQYVSIQDSRIYLLDIESRNMTLLAGNPDDPSTNFAMTFDHDGEGMYFITDEAGLAAELAWKPLKADAKTTYLTPDIHWDINQFALSKDGRRAAFVSNEDGIGRLYLLDTKTKKHRMVDSIPIGLVSGITFNPDDKRLAMTLNTAKTPSDAFVLHLGGKPLSWDGLERWTYSEVGGLDTEQFVEPQLIHFPTFDKVGDKQRTVPAFLYMPEGEGPFPVVIYIHGGPESQYRPSFSSTFQMWVAELGAAVIAPNVRGSLGYGKNYVSLDNGYLREDSVKDIGGLLDWIAQQEPLDAQRVAVYGGSYGGYMVLASAVHYSDRLKAAVDVVGISNFVTFLENTQDYRRDLRRQEYGDERDPQMRAFLQKISPLNNVDKINIPMFVVQGQNDPRVPVTEADQIVAALREQGLPVWYMNAMNEGHGYARKENRDIYQQAAILFLKEYLLR